MGKYIEAMIINPIAIGIVDRYINLYYYLLIKRRIFCMLRNTRSKLMQNILFHLVKIVDTFLKRQTNLSRFSTSSVPYRNVSKTFLNFKIS